MNRDLTPTEGVRVLLEREQEAYATLQELPAIALGEPSYHLRAARLLLDLGYNDDARDHFKRALQLEPDNSDALHGIGMCASEDGDRATMIECFQKVRLADLVGAEWVDVCA